jgi:pectinesterase
MKHLIRIILCLLMGTGWLYAQQTSTDTAWKLKYRLRGEPVPQYPSSLTVSQDGSGDYRSIQEAVNAVRDLSQVRVTIFIRKGTYHEKLVIPSWKKNIALIGEDMEHTIITHDDFSGKANPGGHDQFGRVKCSTYTSFTVLVQGDGFSAENLTIENTAGRVGQAVALHVEADRVMISHCRLLGNQDTLYTATDNSRQYYSNCYIEGTTDFIFGEATAVFDSCTIKSLVNSFVTAAATSPRQAFGYVFRNCRFIAGDNAVKCFLGRPWRPYAKTVFIQCYLGAHIVPEGWNNWGNPANEKTVLYAEYKNYGPGAAISGRAGWSKQLSRKESNAYTLTRIFRRNSSDWLPGIVQP